MCPATGASAATRCGHLIVDPRGNAQMWYLPTKPYNPQADLLSVDASYKRSVIDFTFTMASFSIENTDNEHSVTASGSVGPGDNAIRVRVPLRDIHARYGDVLGTLGVIVGQDLGASEANGGFIEQSTGPGYHYRIGDINGCRPR